MHSHLGVWTHLDAHELIDIATGPLAPILPSHSTAPSAYTITRQLATHQNKYYHGVSVTGIYSAEWGVLWRSNHHRPCRSCMTYGHGQYSRTELPGFPSAQQTMTHRLEIRRRKYDPCRTMCTTSMIVVKHTYMG